MCYCFLFLQVPNIFSFFNYTGGISSIFFFLITALPFDRFSHFLLSFSLEYFLTRIGISLFLQLKWNVIVDIPRLFLKWKHFNVLFSWSTNGFLFRKLASRKETIPFSF